MARDVENELSLGIRVGRVGGRGSRNWGILVMRVVALGGLYYWRMLF